MRDMELIAELDRKAAEELREIVRANTDGKVYDVDRGHYAADMLLCDVLLSHGYVELVDEFKSLRKWYA